MVLQPNTLLYDLYKITYQILNPDTLQLLTPQCSASTYINVTATGLSVYGFEYGISNLKIGFAQGFLLQPNTFTFDNDFIANISNLNFQFYCKKIIKTDNSSFSTQDFGSELKYAQKNNKNQIGSTCFDSICKNLESL